MNKYNSYNSEDSSQIPGDSADQSHSPSWLEWCSDPKVEASIIALSMFVALVSLGLVGR
jgi:hypothetical protein